MSTENDWLIRYGCSLADPQGLQRWREDAERREREFKQARRGERREQQEINSVREVALLRAEVESLRSELAQVRGEIDHRHDVAIEACGQALGEIRMQVNDQMQTAVRDIHNQLLGLIERRHAEVMGRIDAITPDRLRANKTGFRFANERNEDCDTVVHLPNPLRRNVAN
jgi:DNA repair exonuclease SbcCD ATPase subunit